MRVQKFGFRVSLDVSCLCSRVVPGFALLGNGAGGAVDNLLSGYGIQVSGARVLALGYQVLQVRVSGREFDLAGFGFRVSGFGFRVSGFGFRVSG